MRFDVLIDCVYKRNKKQQYYESVNLEAVLALQKSEYTMFYEDDFYFEILRNETISQLLPSEFEMPAFGSSNYGKHSISEVEIVNPQITLESLKAIYAILDQNRHIVGRYWFRMSESPFKHNQVTFFMTQNEEWHGYSDESSCVIYPWPPQKDSSIDFIDATPIECYWSPSGETKWSATVKTILSSEKESAYDRHGETILKLIDFCDNAARNNLSLCSYTII